ncbi:hypothetical protein BC833DRAFT_569489 [Globomyces pollinis-pini]|nr:hypothetical protein BC833DRAFT_569489 [Globomyces pollinis-pini]
MIFKSNVLRNYDNYFSIGQLLSDLSLSVTVVISFSLTLNNSVFLQNHSNCQITGWLLNLLTLLPLFFALNIPTSAYRIIVKEKPALTFNQTMLRIGLILFSSILVATIPIMLHIDFAIQDNQGYCFHDFHSASVNRNLSIITTGIAFGIPLVVVAYVYYSIWKRLHETIHAASFMLNYTLQIIVARRGLLVFIVYIIGYAFPVTGSVYKSLSNKTLPLWMEHLIASLVTCHAFINPLVYYIAEPRLRRNIVTSQIRNYQVAPANPPVHKASKNEKESLVHPFYIKVRKVNTIEDISDDRSRSS